MKKSPLILQTIKKDISKNKWIYIMAIPVIVFYICFSYIPMAGIQIAFKDFNFGAGIWGSPWVGFKHFISFFQGPYAWRVIRNTLLVSLYTIVVCFPAPILFALLLNEAKNKLFKRTIQTVSYLPHFISLVVICGLIKEFTQSTGLVSTLLAFFGVPQETMLLDPERFRAVYVYQTRLHCRKVQLLFAELCSRSASPDAGLWRFQMPCVHLSGYFRCRQDL